MHRSVTRDQIKLMTNQYLEADNAVMIGWASMHRFLANDTDQYDLDLLPKWSIEDLMN